MRDLLNAVRLSSLTEYIQVFIMELKLCFWSRSHDENDSRRKSNFSRSTPLFARTFTKMCGRVKRRPWRPAAPAATSQISLEFHTFFVSSLAGRRGVEKLEFVHSLAGWGLFKKNRLSSSVSRRCYLVGVLTSSESDGALRLSGA